MKICFKIHDKEVIDVIGYNKIPDGVDIGPYGVGSDFSQMPYTYWIDTDLYKGGYVWIDSYLIKAIRLKRNEVLDKLI
jgi:hypothetical protein